MNELVAILPGNVLSMDDGRFDRTVRKISVEMLPPQSSQHLINFADNLGEGWLDSKNHQLRIQFHAVSIFSHAVTEELCLSTSDPNKKIALTVRRIGSPHAGQAYPQFPWATQSRFVIDEVIDLPDWATGCTRLELLAVVAGKAEQVGIIHVDKNLDGTHTVSAGTGVADLVTEPVLDRTAPNSIAIQEANYPAETAPEDSNISVLWRGADKRVKKINRLFLFSVVLPTLIASIYFGLIASDVYVSESRFVVRSPEHPVSTGIGAILQGTGFSRSQDDTYTVHDFIFSRDALKQLDDQFAVGKSFADKNVDLFSRFSGLDWDNSFEALHRYYQKYVTVDLDSSSSISTLSVRAFTAADAYRMNEKLLEMSEALINQLNERGRQDMIRSASIEVAAAEKKAKETTLAISNYRNAKGVFDPEKQSALQLEQVSKLQDELISAKVQMTQIRTLARDNPQIPSLQKQIETLQGEINSETAKVAGGDRSLANKSIQYEGLVLERSFAEKQLTTALASLEQARNEAQRKQLYLERVAQPSKPDVAVEPRRIRNVFATLVLGLIAWGILTMLLAGIREHQD